MRLPVRVCVFVCERKRKRVHVYVRAALLQQSLTPGLML